MLSAINISASGLVAQRARIDAISSNLANINTTRDEKGEISPYQRKMVIIQTDPTVGANGAAGVKARICQPETVDPIYKVEPNNPDRIKEGPHKDCVAYPNVNMMVEFADAMVAQRAYEANLGAMQIAKDMEQQSLKIIA
jgi:flagellar basal-body rod protein FlgC